MININGLWIMENHHEKSPKRWYGDIFLMVIFPYHSGIIINDESNITMEHHHFLKANQL
jgi:hypothetical protein